MPAGPLLASLTACLLLAYLNANRLLSVCLLCPPPCRLSWCPCLRVCMHAQLSALQQLSRESRQQAKPPAQPSWLEERQVERNRAELTALRGEEER